MNNHDQHGREYVTLSVLGKYVSCNGGQEDEDIVKWITDDSKSEID